MKESEIRKLFMLIQNAYSNFTHDDFKVEYWRRLLDNTPAELAQANFERYCLNPDNAFPPHPGVLAQKAVQQAEGRYIPNVEETRKMLEERQDWISLPCPAHLKEQLPWNTH